MREAGTDPKGAAWMRHVLRAAGVYNLIWGVWVVLFPVASFHWAQIEPPRYPQIWQCVGMMVGVYGVGYLIAASHPLRHWPIVLVGLLGKVIFPIGFLWAVATLPLPWMWGLTIVTNDLIWWVPFVAILAQAWWASRDSSSDAIVGNWDQAIRQFRSHRGATLDELSRDSPTLVVFLRHAGCAFCRANLAKLSQQRGELEATGVRLAIVHMSNPMSATLRVQRYNLEDVHRFSDPTCQLYRAFGLQRASLGQLVGLRVWWQGFLSAIWEGHGFGRPEGDEFRLPGVFLLQDGQIVAHHSGNTPADRPDYLSLVRSAKRTQQADDSNGEVHASPAVS